MPDSLTELHHKHHPTKFPYFCSIFEAHFSALRESATSVLEIGVQEGNSVRMWKDYFPNAIIHGVDVPWTPHRFAESRIVEHLGDQRDRDFLRSLVKECGAFDVVIDDGGHMMDGQIISLEELFPAVRPGGVYAVEDTFSSYWKNWGGSYLNRRRYAATTFIEYAKGLVDSLHSEHYKNHASADYPPKQVYQFVDPPLRGFSDYPGDWIDEPRNYFDTHVASVHFYPALAFIHKE